MGVVTLFTARRRRASGRASRIPGCSQSAECYTSATRYIIVARVPTEGASRVNIPQYTLEEYERDFADRHLLHAVVAKWASERAERTAIIEFDTGREVTYRQFDDATTTWALRLLEL